MRYRDRAPVDDDGVAWQCRAAEQIANRLGFETGDDRAGGSPAIPETRVSRALEAGSLTAARRGLKLALAALVTAAFVLAGDARTPVLVELFTSEGCSSCPPADALLIKLETQQPFAPARVIALSQHVDYWDRLGWKDPFSSPAFTGRQREYTRGDSYTPQMIVDGGAAFVGSDVAKAGMAIQKAALAPKAPINLSRGAQSGTLRIHAEGLPDTPADVMLAIVEDNLVTNVERGENAGKSIAHVAVARRLSAIGKTKGGSFTGDAVIKLDRTWKHENVRAVVFVQERLTRRILGVQAIPLDEAR
ncbi:MAG: DUF1223 domain-containing protein [Bryobacterales bacterium]|nr:DUF1223 domain-containing protein [Bryobacterales bacterium]